MSARSETLGGANAGYSTFTLVNFYLANQDFSGKVGLVSYLCKSHRREEITAQREIPFISHFCVEQQLFHLLNFNPQETTILNDIYIFEDTCLIGFYIMSLSSE